MVITRSQSKKITDPNSPGNTVYESPIDKSISIHEITRGFELIRLSEIVASTEPRNLPKEVTGILGEIIHKNLPGVCYNLVENPSEVVTLLMSADQDRFTNMYRALKFKASQRGENSTHVLALYRAYHHPNIYSRRSQFEKLNLVQLGANEGSNEAHSVNCRDDFHYVLLRDVKLLSLNELVSFESIEGPVWLRLMVTECKKKMIHPTNPDIGKGIREGVARCSEIRQKLHFRHEKTGTYFEPAVPVLIFAGNNYSSLTVIPIPCALAVLLGLSTSDELQKLMTSRKDLESDINTMEAKIETLEMKIELYQIKQQYKDLAEVQKNQLQKDLIHAQQEYGETYDDLKEKKQILANMGPYPTTMWISKNEFNDTIAEEFNETKKVQLYTGINGISSIGQVVRASGLLAQEILDYLGVEYRISHDNLLDEYIPPLFHTMSMQFSLPHGPVRYSNRTNVYIWEKIAAIKHFSYIDEYNREIKNFKMLDSKLATRPKMIAKDDVARIVMYSFCGWPLSKALQLEAVPACSSTLREYFEQILEQVQCLHENGLVHLDIKPGNVMVNTAEDGDNVVVTLIDYEFLVEEGQTINGPRGSRGFWAPELTLDVDEGITVTCEMDMYSVAKTFLHSSVQKFDHNSTFDPEEDVSLTNWIERNHGGWCDLADESVKRFLGEMLPPCLSPRSQERWTAAMAIKKLNEIW